MAPRHGSSLRPQRPTDQRPRASHARCRRHSSRLLSPHHGQGSHLHRLLPHHSQGSHLHRPPPRHLRSRRRLADYSEAGAAAAAGAALVVVVAYRRPPRRRPCPRRRPPPPPPPGAHDHSLAARRAPNTRHSSARGRPSRQSPAMGRQATCTRWQPSQWVGRQLRGWAGGWLPQRWKASWSQEPGRRRQVRGRRWQQRVRRRQRWRWQERCKERGWWQQWGRWRQRLELRR